MYVTSETLAWFDPALLSAEHHFDADSDEHIVARQLIATATRRRLEAETLSNCAMNSRSVHAAANAFYRDAPSLSRSGTVPSIGARVERPVCPMDTLKEPISHFAAAGGTYAAITEGTTPPLLCLFDRDNHIAITRLPLVWARAGSPLTAEGQREIVRHGKVTRVAAESSGLLSSHTNENTSDASNRVGALLLDPRGNFCLVRWRSGRSAYWHIPRRSRNARRGGVVHESENTNEDSMELPTPRQVELHFRQNIMGTDNSFALECVAWDPTNHSDTSTGDVIIGSSRGGVLVGCQLEPHTVSAARRLIQLPPPYENEPIDSVTYTVVATPGTSEMRRHVVLVAQCHRLFVFASPWSRESTIDAAFTTLMAASTELTNFITLPPAPATDSHAVFVEHGVVSGVKTSSSQDHEVDRTVSQVTLLDPSELFPRSPGNAMTSALPVVFYWRYGDTLTHGIILTESIDTCSTTAKTTSTNVNNSNGNGSSYDIRTTSSTSMGMTGSYTMYGNMYDVRSSIPPSSPMRGVSNAAEGGISRSNGVLPIWVLSVVNLTACFRLFATLLHGGVTRRPRLFRLSSEPLTRKTSAYANGGKPSRFQNLHVTDVEALAQLHHTLRRRAGEPHTVKSFSRRASIVHRGTQAEGSSGAKSDTHEVGQTVMGTKRNKNDPDHYTARGEDEDEEESLISFTMGYGHFVVTSTRAVYAFCHFAALPFRQDPGEWKNSLVFSQPIASSSDAEGSRTWTFATHHTGRSQLFHLFAPTYIVDFRLGHRCRTQYVAQLIDTVSLHPRGVAVSDHGDESFATMTTQRDEKTVSSSTRNHTVTADTDLTMSPSTYTMGYDVPLTTNTVMDMDIAIGGDGGWTLTQPQTSNGATDTSSSPLALVGDIGSAFLVRCASSLYSHLPHSTTGHDTPLPSSSENGGFMDAFITAHGVRAVPLRGAGMLGGALETGAWDGAFYSGDVLYEMALRLAATATHDREELLCSTRQGYAARLFRQRRYLEAAAQYGLIPPGIGGSPYFNALLVAFGRVVVDDMEPLLLLLLLRLRGYERHARGFGGHSMEVSCLATWLVSLLLERCNQLDRAGHGADAVEDMGFECESNDERREGGDKSVGENVHINGTSSFDTLEMSSTDLRRSREMRAFLRRKYGLRHPRRLLDDLLIRCQTFVEWSAVRTAVFGIAAPEQTASLCGAFRRDAELLSYLLCQRDRPLEGMVCLEQRSASPAQQQSPNATLRYSVLRYASLFMRRCPCRFVRRGLIPHSSALGVAPTRLFPALLLYNPRRNESTLEADGEAELVLQRHDIEESLLETERARAPYHAAQLYLEHVTHAEGYNEASLTSLMLFFLARDGSDADLTRFLSDICQEERVGNDTHEGGRSPKLDMTYACRLCWRLQRPLGCAWAYFALGRYGEAVRLAISLRNESLAVRFIRSMPITENAQGALRRTLWGELAAATARNRQGGSRRALQFVAESDGELDVSNVLPHLFADVMMMEFRHELMASVASFGNTLAELRGTINASAKDAEVLRRDAMEIRRRPVTLPATSRCASCGQSALTRPFVVFRACQHVFHKTCFDARRANMEAELQQKEEPHGAKGGHSGAGRALECVLCSARYLRLLLEAPLSRSTQGNLPRLP